MLNSEAVKDVFKQMLKDFDLPKVPVQRTVIVSTQAIQRLKASGSYYEKCGDLFIDAPDHPFIHGCKVLEQPMFEAHQFATFPKISKSKPQN